MFQAILLISEISLYLKLFPSSTENSEFDGYLISNPPIIVPSFSQFKRFKTFRKWNNGLCSFQSVSFEAFLGNIHYSVIVYEAENVADAVR